MNPTLIVALAAALIGPLVAYVTAARKLSGKVATTDASELWKESKSIRDDYRDRLRYCDEQLRLVRAQVHDIEDENVRLKRRVRMLERYVTELGGEINGSS